MLEKSGAGELDGIKESPTPQTSTHSGNVRQTHIQQQMHVNAYQRIYKCIQAQTRRTHTYTITLTQAHALLNTPEQGSGGIWEGWQLQAFNPDPMELFRGASISL